MAGDNRKAKVWPQQGDPMSNNSQVRTTRRGFIRMISVLLASSAVLFSGLGSMSRVLAAEGDTATAAAQKTVDAILAILRKPDFNFETDSVAITGLVKGA